MRLVRYVLACALIGGLAGASGAAADPLGAHLHASHQMAAAPAHVAPHVSHRASRSGARVAFDAHSFQLARARVLMVQARARAAKAARLARARARAHSTSVCTAAHWRRTMSWQEVWIDTRESTMNPRSVNPSSGALGLGQLLPSTYRDLGIPISYDPCAQLRAERAYMTRRYGSEDAAVAFWRSHGWY